MREVLDTPIERRVRVRASGGERDVVAAGQHRHGHVGRTGLHAALSGKPAGRTRVDRLRGRSSSTTDRPTATVAYLGELAARDARVRVMRNRPQRRIRGGDESRRRRRARGDRGAVQQRHDSGRRMARADCGSSRGRTDRAARSGDESRRQRSRDRRVVSHLWRAARVRASARGGACGRAVRHPDGDDVLRGDAARRAGEAIGPLDERFEIGLFEDDDYAMRVRQAGYRVVCAEDVFVHHFGQASIGRLGPTGQYGAVFHANRARWEEKWGVAWQPYERREKPAYRDLVGRIRQLVSRRGAGRRADRGDQQGRHRAAAARRPSGLALSGRARTAPTPATIPRTATRASRSWSGCARKARNTW